MSYIEFGEDWTSSFGEEDVLTYCGRTHGRTDARTDKNFNQVAVISDPRYEKKKYFFPKNRKKRTGLPSHIAVPYRVRLKKGELLIFIT